MNWLASENGFVHACGHRGHSTASPENTIAALQATLDNGGTTAEIDVVLAADGEIVLMHDLTLERTTNGKGLVANYDSAALAQLDAGSHVGEHFAGEPVPTLREVLKFSKGKLGLVVEIKEVQRVDTLLEQLAMLLEETNSHDQVIVISFDHHVLLHVKDVMPQVRTEGITHARHVDFVGVARAAKLDSLSIEFRMFHPDDAAKLHDAGIAIRCHLPRPDRLAYYETLGLPVTAQLGNWLADGYIDSLSNDDVAYVRQWVDRFPLSNIQG